MPEKLRGRYVPNGRFFYAKLGSKAGAEHSLRMLPDVSDLVADVAVPGAVSTWAYEQMVSGKLGEGVCLYLVGVVGSVVFIIVASGFGELWTWAQVMSISTSIVGRIGTP